MAIYNSANNSYQSFNKTLFEAVVLADQFGNMVGPANPSGMAVDAFGRARMSTPYTLFDSFHRYQDNGKIVSANSATGATMSHNANGGCIDCTLDTTSGSFIYRESSKVFNYQPGKSLQVLESFNLAAPKTNLRQRYGYFGTQNGFYLEVDGSTVYFVRRSYVTGTVVNTRIPQSQWNIDKLDGAGPSNLTLDITKSQILFTDIEWLGVGSVRMGFIINGQLIHCHTFNHANASSGGPYMTTACLPIRAEIENTGTTDSSSTLKVICSSVISEGGFEPKGRIRAIGMEISSPKDIPTAGTYVPLISIRLKDSRQDAIAIIRSIQFLGVTNNTTYKWKVVSGGSLTGASWNSASSDSSIEYDISATAITGGAVFREEFVNVASGAGAAISQIDPSDIYKYQLERNSFAANNNGVIYSVVATGAGNGNDALASIQWEEIT